MAKVSSDKVIVSIDIGTTKISVLVAHCIDEHTREIIGIGKAASDGLRKGVVYDIARTIKSITAAVKEAELMAGITIESAYIGISGGHIQSCNSNGIVPIKGGQVQQRDIANVLAAAQAIVIPEGHKLLHVLPQYYIIDKDQEIRDPLGMHGIRLEVQAHIILGSISSVQNLVNCCEAAGVRVTDIILEQLASGNAVLSSDERELGVAMLDIGGGTSDLAMYQGGSIRHTMVLPVAGNHFTNDLALGLRIALDDAEKIKQQYGSVSQESIDYSQEIQVKMANGQDFKILNQDDLVHILRPRAHEILSLIYKEIRDKKLGSLMRSGLVITGGGSLLDGMSDLAQEIFNVPVRIGKVHSQYSVPETLKHPMYATGYGLLIYALEQQKKRTNSYTHGPVSARIFMRMKSWVADFF